MRLRVDSGGGGFVPFIPYSMEFPRERTVYLSAGDYTTPSQDGKKWFIDVWYLPCNTDAKRSEQRTIFGWGSAGNRFGMVKFNAGKVQIYEQYSGGVLYNVEWTLQHVDDGMFQHLRFEYDSTKTEPSDRIEMRRNGGTNSKSGSSQFPALNAASILADTNNTITVGKRYDTTDYLDGYLAALRFDIGAIADPEEWAYSDGNSEWRPRNQGNYSFSPVGLELLFDDSAAMGKNTAPGANLSFSGTGTESNTQRRTNPEATAPRLFVHDGITEDWLTLDRGGRRAVSTGLSSNSQIARTNIIIPKRGKWACQFDMSANLNNSLRFGVCEANERAGYFSQTGSSSRHPLISLRGDGKVFNRTTEIATITGYTSGEVHQAVVDADARTVSFWRDGVLNGGPYAIPRPGNSDRDLVFAANVVGSGNWVRIEPGDGISVGDPADPDAKWLTSRSEKPDILKSWDYVNSFTANGNDTLNERALNFVTGFAMHRSYSVDRSTLLADTLRPDFQGGGKFGLVKTDNSAAEYVEANGDLRVESPGHRAVGSAGQINSTGETYHTVRIANDDEVGFAIVTTTGDGVPGRAIPHGLTEEYADDAFWSMIWSKKLGPGTAPLVVGSGWMDDGADAWKWYYEMNGDGTKLDGANDIYAQSPDGTNFYVGTSGRVNQNNDTYVHYIWFPRRGVSQGFWYSGNNNLRGAQIMLPFLPRWWWAKSATAGRNHKLGARSLSGTNPMSRSLNLNNTGARDNETWLDRTSMGLRITSTEPVFNENTRRFNGWAMAERPRLTTRGI